MQFHLAKSAILYNPIDSVEAIFTSHNWDFERRNRHEIALEVQGKWSNIVLFFNWEKGMHALHISGLMDLNIPACQKNNFFELLALTNEQLWVGHFSYWSEQSMPVFKHSVLLEDSEQIVPERINEIINIVIKECERFYPVFKFVFEKNQNPSSALSAVWLETMGEA